MRCASQGTRIAVGEEFKLPFTVTEPSMLDIQWSSADEVDVEFTLSFKAFESEDVKDLIPAERTHSNEGKMDITESGEAILRWNNCFAGWLGGSACKLSYTVTLLTVQEVADREREKKKREEEEALMEKQRQEEERMKKFKEEAAQRRADRAEKIATIEKSSAQTEAELETVKGLVASQESTLIEEKKRLQQFQELVAEAEKALISSSSKVGALEQELASNNKKITLLYAENAADNMVLENGGTNGKGHISYADLEKPGAAMTNEVIRAFEGHADFHLAGKKKFEELLERDREDGEKLQTGINLAIDKGVLEADVQVEPIKQVNVTNRTPEDISQEIVAALGDAPSKGCCMTLQGLSGLGKGTTVDCLKAMIPNAQTWSNGDIFRSITLLATRFAIQERFSDEEKEKFKAIIVELKGEGALKSEFDTRIKELLTPADVLTKENLASFFGMLSFDKFKGDKFDTKIEGLGMTYYVSEVNLTVLKTISKFIPAVAEVTQGEVIGFIMMALDKLTASGINVLLEGREQTLNYIRTPHRFELVTDDNNAIGVRQAAQIMGNAAKAALPAGSDDSTVMATLIVELSKLPKASEASGYV